MLIQAKQGGTIGIVADSLMFEPLRDEECDRQAASRGLDFWASPVSWYKINGKMSSFAHDNHIYTNYYKHYYYWRELAHMILCFYFLKNFYFSVGDKKGLRSPGFRWVPSWNALNPW